MALVRARWIAPRAARATTRPIARGATPFAAFFAGAFLVTLAVTAYPGLGRAAGPASAGLEIRPITETWPDRSHIGPIGKWMTGAALRLRYIELADVNSLGLDPDARHSVLMLRTQVSVTRRLTPNSLVFARLVNEASRYSDCDSCTGGLGEIDVENLYLESLEPRGLPLGVRFGRQNLFYGDGLLVADGTPLDGERTVYVNGLLVTSTVPLWDFDFFVAVDPAREDYLPRINNKEVALSETDDFLWGVFLRREPAPGTRLRYSIEPYYIYKSEKDEPRISRIHTVGARLGFGLGNAEATGEIAYQGGRVPAFEQIDLEHEPILAGSGSISAIGGLAKLTVRLSPPLPLDLEGGYVYLDGDQRETRNKYEGWNPVLGRWAIWSELYVYTLALEAPARPMEQGLAFWTNLKMPYFKVSYDRGGPLGLEARYLWMDAVEDFTLDPFISPDYAGPTHRGELFTVKLTWDLPRFASGHVLYERFLPGDFYDLLEIGGFTPKDATYLRFELSRSF